jgi:hypothetical protein
MSHKPNPSNYTEQDFNFQKGKEDRIIATESFDNALNKSKHICDK